MNRRGFTLVELLLVLSCSSVVMVTAVGLVATVMKTQRQSRNHNTLERNYIRLERFFRNDAAMATAVTSSSESNQLTLAGTEPITYSFSGDVVTRTVLRVNATPAREDFQCAKGSAISFDVSTDSTFVTLLIQRNVAGKDEPRLECQVQARIASRPQMLSSDESKLSGGQDE